jgi:hypothetical protein
MASAPYPPGNQGIPPQPYAYQQAPAPYGGTSQRGNPVGMVAFVAGMLLVLWQFLGTVIQAGFAVTGDFTALEAFGWINSGVGIVLGLVALIAGIVAIVLRGRNKVLGAIGLGIGILSLAGVISFAVIYPLITGFS